MLNTNDLSGKKPNKIVALTLSMIMLVTTFFGFGDGLKDVFADESVNNSPTAIKSIKVTPDAEYASATDTYNFRTYIKDGVNPPPLKLKFTVDFGETFDGGSYIKVPLNYNTKDIPGFSTPYGDLFTYEGYDNDVDQIIASITTESETNGDKYLKIALDDEKASTLGNSTKEFRLIFNFNNNYSQKVPNATPMWNLTPVVKDNTNSDTIGKTAKITTASPGVTWEPYAGSYNWTAGEIPGINSLMYQNADKTLLKPGTQVTLWMMIPTGSTITANGRNFVDSGTETIDGISYTKWQLVYEVQDNGKLATSVFPETATYIGLGMRFIPPESIRSHTSFKIFSGGTYTPINGSEKDIYIANGDHSGICTVNVSQIPDWDFNVTNSHGSNIPGLVKVGPGDNIKAGYYNSIGSGSFASGNNLTKNKGLQTVTGVKAVVYQTPKDEGEKININRIDINFERGTTSSPWNYYKVIFDIKNYDDESERTVETPSFTTTDTGLSDYKCITSDDENLAHFTSRRVAFLPTLDADKGEYIDKMTIIPMGTDGESEHEGELASQNGFNFTYCIRSWNGQKFPSGTSITGKTVVVPTYATVYYNDANGLPTTMEKNTAYNYYSNEPGVGAGMYSTNGSKVYPGDMVDYQLRGYLQNNKAGEVWNDPIIAVRIPAGLELRKTDGTLLTSGNTINYTDSNNDIHEGNVIATKESEDSDGTSYWSFQVNGDFSSAQNAVQVFSIPLKVKVKGGATARTYKFDRHLVSSKPTNDFFNFTNGNDNIRPDEDASKYGFELGEHYSNLEGVRDSTLPTRIFTSTSLVVGEMTNIDTSTTVKTSGTGGEFVSNDIVAATHGETVTVRGTIKNNGNVNMNNIRYYQILPYDGDALHSEGGVSFESIKAISKDVDGTEKEVTNATIYYYTGDIDKLGTFVLPSYGKFATPSHTSSNVSLDAAVFFNSDAGRSAGWTTSLTAANKNDVKAVFVVFPATELTLKAAGQVNIDVGLKVPDDEDVTQIAYSQYRYSAKKVISPFDLKEGNSKVCGISTAAMTLAYNQNLPSWTNDTAAENMPDAVSDSWMSGNTNTIAVDTTKTPTITNGTFLGWFDSATGGTKVTGDVNFSAAGTKTLYAHWKYKGASVAGMELDEAHYDSLKVKGAAIATNPCNQEIEYAITSASATEAPTAGWGSSDTFSGRNKDTDYKIWARAKAKEGTSTTDLADAGSPVYITAKTLDLAVELPNASDLSKVYNGYSQQAPGILKVYEVDKKGTTGTSDDEKTEISLSAKYKATSSSADYTLSIPSSYKDVGTYYVNYKVTGTGTNAVTGQYEFNITPYEIGAADVTWSDLSKVYNGEEQKPTVKFAGIGGDSSDMYNLDVTGATYYKEGGHTVTATMPTVDTTDPRHNYKLKAGDTFTNTFNITKKAISANWILYNSENVADSDFESVYDSHEYTMKATINTNSLAKTTDANSFASGSAAFTYNSESNGTNVATYRAQVTGLNAKSGASETDTNIVGSYTVGSTVGIGNSQAWTITPYGVDADDVQWDNLTKEYNGSKQYPTAAFNGIGDDNGTTFDLDVTGATYYKEGGHTVTATMPDAQQNYTLKSGDTFTNTFNIEKLKANVSWKLYKTSDLQNPIDDGSKGFNVPEDGSEYVMKATVTNFIGDDESYLKDYVYSETSKASKVGEYTVKVTGATAKDADVSANVSAKATGDGQKALDSYDISSEAKWTIAKVAEEDVDKNKDKNTVDTDIITSKDGGSGNGDVSGGSESGDSSKDNGEKVETGDNRDVIPFTLASLLALGGILVIVRRKKQD